MASIARKWAALSIIVKMLIGAVRVGGMWHAETRRVLWVMIREEWQDDDYAGEGGE
jgi:hypothetical protein